MLYDAQGRPAMKQAEERIRTQLAELREFTSTKGAGTTRFPFTKEARDASEYLAARMREAGLTVRMDNTGSVIGRLKGQVPETVMIGSHLDSVLNGGAYDGIGGVAAGLEAVRQYLLAGEKPWYSIEVIATNDEEGARFRSGLFTGKALLGQFTPDDLKKFVDKDGISEYEAMEAYGLRPQEIGQHVRTDLKAFLEIHIEQGPVMELAKKDIGVVDVITGIRRVLVNIRGRADHSGTMPMDLRKDAMEAAAKVVAGIGDCARRFPQTVATVGHLNVEPNIINIVPEKVSFIVDMRSASQEVLDEQYRSLLSDLEAVCGHFSMPFDTQVVLDVAPVEMDASFRGMIEASCRERGFPYMHLFSGAGHDAEVFGAVIPAAMIFVPSIGGRSHCPEELTDERTLAEAAFVAADVLREIQRGRRL